MCGLTIQFCGLTIQSGFRHRREYACLGLTTSEFRVYTPESRQATARDMNSTAKNRTGLGDCETNARPMVVTQNAIQCARRLSGSDKPTWRCGAPIEYFSYGCGLQFFIIFGDWSYLAMWTTIILLKKSLQKNP